MPPNNRNQPSPVSERVEKVAMPCVMWIALCDLPLRQSFAASKDMLRVEMDRVRHRKIQSCSHFHRIALERIGSLGPGRRPRVTSCGTIHFDIHAKSRSNAIARSTRNLS